MINILWFRNFGNLTVTMCDSFSREWGLCLNMNEDIFFQKGTSLGLGWGYLIIPFVIGIVIGGLFVYVIMVKLKRKKE